MRNVEVVIQNDQLIIKLDISKGALAAAVPSKTGKTKVIASTGGNQAVAKLPDGREIMLGVNAYVAG